ncbi:MAG: A/G-specific adenine glycosylase [Bacteroidetes bacterium]|nr:A/G-specific adenine glycosylase [Bacteroidota bacterium]
MDFSVYLIRWYKQNKRDLPWRTTKDPYKIWLSEIILQQTRVEQGLSYYLKFIEHYPTVNDLASAHEEEVLKLWQGLGYYSRARNLHSTAIEIKNKYNAVFPDELNEIRNLKGIGDYTAAAILSFSHNKPYPVVDGNVYRVLSRIFGIEDFIDSSKGRNIFKALAEELIDKKNPAIYNQAIMEFGAIHCKPKQPLCEECCFQYKCYALKNNEINNLPKKEKQAKQRNRFFNYLVITNEIEIILNKRTEKDIWTGLFDFPLIETAQSVDDFNQLITKNYLWLLKKENIVTKSDEFIHQLSHQKIHAVFWKIKTSPLKKIETTHFITSINTLESYPVPKLVENYIKSLLQNL